MNPTSSADTILITGPVANAADEAEPILRMLPEWFGIPSATRQYLRQMVSCPTWLARQAGACVGFITIKQHFDHAAEILVMGVLPTHQGKGIGHRLVEAVEQHLIQRDTAYLQVKTLGPSHPDRYYAQTRHFYESIGFTALEELPHLWDETNPCLIYIKRLGEATS